MPSEHRTLDVQDRLAKHSSSHLGDEVRHMAQLQGPKNGLSVHRLRAVLAHVKAECILDALPTPAIDHDGGATLTEGKLELGEPKAALEYLIERFDWRDAYADRVELRARERNAISVFDRVVLPGFFATLRGEALSTDSRKQIVRQLRDLAQTAHATGFRVGNALSLWIAPAWTRMRWLRDASPLAGMIGEWMELGGWLEAAAAQPSVARTAPSRSEVLDGLPIRDVARAG
ncbi:MAG: hypothetical protein AB7I19_17980 [Planctomycetota bacterium]